MPKMTALLDGGGGGGGDCSKSRGPMSCIGGVLFAWRGGAYRKVEGVHFAKWRGCILLSGGGVFCYVEGVYFAMWRGCSYITKWRGSQSGGGVFYILQGTSVTII